MGNFDHGVFPVLASGYATQMPGTATVWNKCGEATAGAVAGLVGIEVGVVSGVSNLESPGVSAPDRRPRHEEAYHAA